ncbi:MAG: DUF559 domain-containing protein [Mycolicibacterium neoaurum]|uniref:DUF559 domain-containing protein n=1 Tax=Mycolicibacterium neoaurum TaxID=1795 RepID=UPI002FF44A3D
MLEDYLRDHDGVITLAQAGRCGISPQAVRRRIGSGVWRRCSQGVYFVDDRPFTDAARIRAAVWGYGDDAVASGLAAAWWYGFTQYPPAIAEVTVPRNSHGRTHPGSRVRRRDLDPADVAVHRGLPLTARPLTIVEAAVRRGGGARIMDRALQGDSELRDLWRAQTRNKGRYGSPAARRLLLAAADGSRSAAERLLIKLLRQADITGWRANVPAGPYFIDVAFAERMIAVEVDGWAFHTDPDAFTNDRRRQNYLIVHGWQVLRFTWLDLSEYPDRVIATILSAISAR